uniref:Uncharacterized protein n=1 Tax=Arundo donax TaxID=35708 RepID=A0A0A9GRL9_ARUDO
MNIHNCIISLARFPVKSTLSSHRTIHTRQTLKHICMVNW